MAELEATGLTAEPSQHIAIDESIQGLKELYGALACLKRSAEYMKDPEGSREWVMDVHVEWSRRVCEESMPGLEKTIRKLESLRE